MPRLPSGAQILRDLGRRIRRARLEAGLTQEAAAHAAEIDYKRWQRIESGAANPTTLTLVRVAGSLKTTIWKLMGPRG